MISNTFREKAKLQAPENKRGRRFNFTGTGTAAVIANEGITPAQMALNAAAHMPGGPRSTITNGAKSGATL